jgi:tellurite methyltransferase
MTMNESEDASLPADWEARYASTGGSYFFGTEPSALGRLTVHYWRVCYGDRPARALDLGCGEGRDAVFFARQGWRVTALDKSPTAIERACELAGQRDVRLEAAICADLRECPPIEQFDLIFAGCSIGALGGAALGFLSMLRHRAPEGCVHAVRSPTREAWGDEDPPGLYRFDHNELKFEYRGWRLLYYGEDILYVPHMDRMASFADVIAQKPA